jgi:hypothetical protein
MPLMLTRRFSAVILVGLNPLGQLFDPQVSLLQAGVLS